MDAIHDECLHLVIDFKLFVQEKHVSFYASTCSLGELDEKTNSIKNLKAWNFEPKGYKRNDFFFGHLVSCLYSLSSKFLALGANHMCMK